MSDARAAAREREPSAHAVTRFIGVALLTGLGLGRVPLAPGTLGSLLPVLLALGLAFLNVVPGAIDAALLATAVLCGWSCVHFGHLAEQHFGREDPPQVVADEIAGQALVLLLMPWRMPAAPDAMLWNSAWAAAAFVLFRAFDILKPGPIRRMQELPRGAGVLADDLLAGVCAAIVLQAVMATVNAVG